MDNNVVILGLLFIAAPTVGLTTIAITPLRRTARARRPQRGADPDAPTRRGMVLRRRLTCARAHPDLRLADGLVGELVRGARAVRRDPAPDRRRPLGHGSSRTSATLATSSWGIRPP